MRLLRSLLYYALLLIAAVPVGIGCLLTWPVTSAKWRYDVIADWGKRCGWLR